MTDVLNKNLELLGKHQPYVYLKLMKYINGEYKSRNNSIQKIIVARCDDIVVNLLIYSNDNEYLICDHEDPIGQAYAWIDKYTDPSNKAEIVFGMGFGYHLEVLLASFSNKKVIIVEPDIELFYQILKIKNLELIIKKSEIIVDEVNQNVLGRIDELLWNTDKGGIQCQPFEVYGEMFPDIWDDLRTRFIKKIQNFTVDITTRRFLGELWISNYIKNAEKITEASDANALAGRFRDVPGILVSAGPSLSKNVGLLNGIKDSCVIMAAGTAVNVLEDYGVTPHFMVGIDAGEAEAEKHSRVKSTDIFFLYSNQIATGSIEHYKGPKFLMNFSIDLYTSEFFKFAGIPSEVFLSGPSVANTCVDMLVKMGCNPIILIGQDLAFTGGSNYAGEASGSVVNESTDVREKNLVPEKDIHGNDVYTSLSYLTMKNWFEGYFERMGGSVEIINATQGGLNIQYARNDTLENVIKEFDFKNKGIYERIRGIHREGSFDGNIQIKLKDYKANINSEIILLENYSIEQLRLVDLIKRDIYHPGRDKKAFDKLAARISGLTDKVMKSAIYPTLLGNLMDIEFFLIKMEVDRTTKEMKTYEEVKEFYIQAIVRQNEILKDKLEIVKRILTI